MSDYMDGSGVQYHLNIQKGDVGRYVILPAIPSVSPSSPVTSMVRHWWQTTGSTSPMQGTLEGERVSVTSTGIGGPVPPSPWRSSTGADPIPSSGWGPAAASPLR